MKEIFQEVSIGKKELLNQIPEFIQNDLTVPVMSEGEVVQRDLISVIDHIFDESKSAEERLQVLTKAELAVRRMAIAFEKKYKEIKNEFRVWKAGKMEILSRSDDKNPLVQGDYEKITESVKKSYLRKKYDEYENYRKKIDKYRTYKNLMWNMKDAFVNLSNNFSNIHSKEGNNGI